MIEKQNIKVVALEGMHSAGKSTQIDRVKDKLEEDGVVVKSIRGYGSRKGLGESHADPYSAWWQDNLKKIKNAGTDGVKAVHAEQIAQDRILREIHINRDFLLPRLMQKQGADTAVLLLDRSIISRMFVHNRFDTGFSVNDLLTANNEKTGKKTVVDLPDRIILLHITKDEALNRNNDRVDGKEKIAFNEQVIRLQHDQFENIVKSLPAEVYKVTTLIDASRDVDSVTEDIIKEIYDVI
jgi:thymidylate kinase